MVFLQAWGCISMDYTLGVSLACFYWMSVDYGVLCRSVDAPLPDGVNVVFVILQAFCWQRCHSGFPWSVITAFFSKKHFPFVNTADFRGFYGGNNKVFSWPWPCTGWVNRAFTHQVNRAFTHQVNRAFTRQVNRAFTHQVNRAFTWKETGINGWAYVSMAVKAMNTGCWNKITGIKFMHFSWCQIERKTTVSLADWLEMSRWFLEASMW